MTTETTPDGGTVAQQEVKPQPTEGTPASIEEALKLIDHLKGVNREVISTRDAAKAKLRELEAAQAAKEQAEQAEQGKFKELYEATANRLKTVEETVKTKSVEAAIKDALRAAGARQVDTVAKLIDRSAIAVGEDFSVDTTTVLAQVESLKKADPILFGVTEGNTPPVKRPADGGQPTGYEAELRAAKTPAEVEAVYKKYKK